MSDREVSEWIDGLLTSPEAKPTPPPALRTKIRRAAGRRRRVRLARRLVAAAALLVALVYWPRNEQVVEAPPAPPVATFIAGDDTIAVEIESSSPNVTILQLYPTLSAQRHRQREALLQRTLTPTSYNGG